MPTRGTAHYTNNGALAKWNALHKGRPLGTDVKKSSRILRREEKPGDP